MIREGLLHRMNSIEEPGTVLADLSSGGKKQGENSRSLSGCGEAHHNLSIGGYPGLHS